MSREVLRSASNPAIQRVRAVRAGKEPDQCLLEGARLVDDALAAGLALELVLARADRAEEHAERLAAAQDARLVEAGLLDRTSALDTSPGVLAIARRPPVRSLDDLLSADSAPLVLAVAGISNPGNLGALARSAEAAGAAALVVVKGGARPFGDKALRGSMGSLLRLPVHEVDDVPSAIEALDARGWRQVAASVAAGEAYRARDWSGAHVLWIPGEVGEAGTALEGLDRVYIPMAGGVESLNVTVAASLLLFAAGRNVGGRA